MKTQYKFLNLVKGKIKSKSGDQTWKVGEWVKYEGGLDICNTGLHSSPTIYQAFGYVQGEVLAEVEVRGKHIKQDDKWCSSEMRIIKAWKWQKKDSVALAIYAAELVLNNYEKKYPNDDRPRKAIEAARAVLANDTAKNRAAANSATNSAHSAYYAAYYDANSAYYVAHSAAYSAYSAANSAHSAYYAAYSAANSAHSAYYAAYYDANSATNSAHSAYSAADSAYYDANSADSAAHSADSAADSAYYVAHSAAYSAYYAAYFAYYAFIKKIDTWLNKHLKELEEIK